MRFRISWVPATTACLFAGLIALTLLLNRPVSFPLDDAYITIGNAERILSGGSDGFGLSTPAGATSFLHLMLVAGAGLVLPLPLASLAVSLGAAALYILGIMTLLGRLTGSTVLVLSGTVTALVCGDTWFQLLNGLESGLAMAAVAWCGVFICDQRHRSLAVLAGLLPFIRPELAILAVALGLTAAWRLRHRLGEVMVCIGFAAAAALCTSLLSYLLTGSLVPQTASAKFVFFADGGLPLIRKLLIVAQVVFVSPLFLVLIGVLLVPLAPGGVAFAAFAVVFLLASALSLPSALHHNDFRYLYPLLPIGVAGWIAVADRVRFLRPLVVAVALCQVIVLPGSGWQTYRTGLAVTANQEALASWATRNLPAGSRVLVHDAGYFPWRTDFAVIDLVGLKTLSSIPVHRRLTFPSLGKDRGRAYAEIAGNADAAYVIILNDPFWSGIARALTEEGWKLTPLFQAGPGQHELFALGRP